MLESVVIFIFISSSLSASFDTTQHIVLSQPAKRWIEME